MELSVKNDKLIGHFQAERDMVALRSENMEDRLDDDRENYGEIVLSGFVRFATKDRF